MSNLYLKVKDVQLTETGEFDAFSEEPKTVKHWLIKTDFANSDISVKINPENPKIEVVDLDEHDEGIRKLLRSIGCMSDNAKIEVFGCRQLFYILDAYKISEIREKYDDWKKPKVGDEVRYGSHTGIVLLLKEVLGRKSALVLLRGEGTMITAPIADMEKTGRRFEEVTIKELGEYTDKLPRPKRSND